MSRDQFLKVLGVAAAGVFFPSISWAREKIIYDVKIRIPKRFFISSTEETSSLYILKILDDQKARQVIFVLSNDTTLAYDYENSFEGMSNESMIAAARLKILYSYTLDFFCSRIANHSLRLKCDNNFQSQRFLESISMSDFVEKLRFLERENSN